MIRIGHISDIHINALCTHVGSTKLENGENAYHKERLRRFTEAVFSAIKQGVQAIVLSGDIFDKNKPTPNEYYQLTTILDQVPENVSIFAITGNHDESGNRGSPLITMVRRRSNLYIATKEIIIDSQPDAEFILAPWGTPLKKMHEALNSMLVDRPRILICHLAITGLDGMVWGEVDGEVGYVSAQEIAELPAEAIMAGHHHDQRSVGVPYAWYAGSPECFTFGEQNQNKGWLLWEIAGGNVRVTRQKTQYTPYRTVEVGEFLETDVNTFDGCFLRIRGELSLQDRPLLISLIRLTPCRGYLLDVTLTNKKSRAGLLDHAQSPVQQLEHYLRQKKISGIPAILDLDQHITQTLTV